MAVLPAPAQPLTGPASGAVARLRLLALIGAGVVTVTLFVPPLSNEARRYDVIETVQFALAALAVPALVTMGAPWRGRHAARSRMGLVTGRLDRLAAARRRQRSLARALAFLVIDMALMIGWRTPVLVDAVVRHRWIVAVEAVTLALGGCGLWLELVSSPPFAPRVARPWRAVLGALAMWTVWIMAYVVGLSHVSWYRAISHGTLSSSADQQIAIGVLWFAAVCAFLPVIFSDLITWLKNDEDPDTELRTLVAAERRAAPGETVRMPSRVPGDGEAPDPGRGSLPAPG